MPGSLQKLEAGPCSSHLDQVLRGRIKAALRYYSGNIDDVARAVGISARGLIQVIAKNEDLAKVMAEIRESKEREIEARMAEARIIEACKTPPPDPEAQERRDRAMATLMSFIEEGAWLPPKTDENANAREAAQPSTSREERGVSQERRPGDFRSSPQPRQRSASPQKQSPPRDVRSDYVRRRDEPPPPKDWPS